MIKATQSTRGDGKSWPRRERAPFWGAVISLAVVACAAPAKVDQDIVAVRRPICSNPVPPPLADISHGYASGVVSYRFVGTAGGPSHLDDIRAKMTDWETLTGSVDFVEDPSNPKAFVINVDPVQGVSGCFASYLPPGCEAAAHHELGHLLGLAHEQQRIDAGRFISLNFGDDVCNDLSEATRYVDTIWSGTNYGPYDETSVVHYGPVLGGDGTYDFTRLDGSVAGLGAQGDNITPGDVSSVQELQARFFNWDRFRSRGTIVGSGPLVPQLVPGVMMQATGEIAAARFRSIDLSLVFGNNGRVYMSTQGTASSGWREVWTQANNIAATTEGSELVRARATSTGITTQRTTNAAATIAANQNGGDGFVDGLTWAPALSWGQPSGTTVAGFAVASLGSTSLSIVASTSSGQLWMRHTTSLTSVTGSWIQITSGIAPGRPAAVAFAGEIRVFYATAAGGVTTLRDRHCSTTSCGSSTAVTSVQAGTTGAATASASTLHLAIRNPNGRLDWRRYDVSDIWRPVGGLLVAQPALTNSFEDRFGSFGLFAVLNDNNLWRKTYNRYFQGRLSNLPPNDYDRDGRTDFVLVRQGTWWIRPSTGFADASFAFGEPGDVFLPAADFGGDGISDGMRFQRSSGTWFPLGVDRAGIPNVPLPTPTAPRNLSFDGNRPPTQFGIASDRPVPGDYDGDWVMDEAVFRPSNGTWYASLSSGAPDLVVPFGVATDRPVPGDYDGDGKTDPAVFRPSVATWFVHPSGGGADIVQVFCAATDRLVPGDYDGDGRTDFGCFRPSTGEWLVRLATGEPDLDITFGTATDRVVPGDYDGDGRMDLAYFRPSTGAWNVLPSNGGSIGTTFGVATDTLPWPDYTMPASTAINDIDRDLRTDRTIVRSGTWWVHKTGDEGDISTALGLDSDFALPAANMAGSGVLEVLAFRPSSGTWLSRSLDLDGTAGAIASLQFGTSTDIPVPGDYDGDGVVDEAVFRPSNGTWFASLSMGGPDLVVQFGVSTDIPVPGDYDGDGLTDPAVFRPSSNTWFAHPSGGGADLTLQWGATGDRLVPADYDGDRRADFAYFRPSTGHWVAKLSGNGATQDLTFGVSTDKLVPGDYDGDGRVDVAVFRPSEGIWYAHPSAGGPDVVGPFGVSTDKLPWPVHIGN